MLKNVVVNTVAIFLLINELAEYDTNMLNKMTIDYVLVTTFIPKAQYVKYNIQINVTTTPPTIPTVPIAKPITGVTTPPPATAVIIRPEI